MTPDLETTFEHDPLTESVIGCVFKVANGLGVGFLEKVYENALMHELRKAGLLAEQQVAVPVHYDGQQVGVYVGDIVVDGRLVLELKACRALEDAHLAQCLNYLRATGMKTCLLINFGTPRPQIRRVSR